MNSHNLLLQALRQPDGWRTLPEGWLEEQVRLYPWFAAPRMLLARRDADSDSAALTSAAVHVYSRARLKAWMTDGLDAELRSLTEFLPGEGATSDFAAVGEPAPEVSVEPAAAVVAPEVSVEPAAAVVAPEVSVDQEAVAEPASPTRSEPALEPAVRSGEEKTFNEWLALYLVKPSPSQREASRDAAEAALRDTPPFTLPQVEVEAARTPVPAGGEPSTHIAPEAPPLPAVFEPAASEIDLGGDSQQLETLIERQRALRARRFGTVAGTNAVSGNADKGYGFSGSSEPAVTETYAGILLAQGKWAEAEAIYQALSLRYPEKSGFFANLIREIQDKKSA